MLESQSLTKLASDFKYFSTIDLFMNDMGKNLISHKNTKASKYCQNDENRNHLRMENFNMKMEPDKKYSILHIQYLFDRAISPIM